MKTRITLTVVALFILSLWALAIHVSQVLRKDLEHFLSQQQLATATHAAEVINDELVHRFELLELVALLVDPARLAEPAQIRPLLARNPVVQTHFKLGLQVFTLAGTPVGPAPAPAFALPPAMVANAVRGLQASGQARLSLPITRDGQGQAVLPIVVPIRDMHGKVAGALVGASRLRDIAFARDLVENVHWQGGNLWVVDPESQLVIAASDPGQILQSFALPGSNRAAQRLIEDPEGVAAAINASGAQALFSTAIVTLPNWRVITEFSTAEAFAPIHRMQQQLLLAALLATLLVGGSTWWAVSRQLSPLAKAARAMADMVDTPQPLHPLPGAGPDEIGRFIRVFNRLLTTLDNKDAALLQSQQVFADILENADAFTFVKDTDFRYVYVNQSVSNWLGVPSGALLGQTDEQFFDAPTNAQLRVNDRLVFEEGKTLKTEETTVKKDGRITTFLTVKLPLRNEAGKIYGLCAISTDITARKQAEDELRIAAAAFDMFESIMVLDASLKVLRVNQAFTRTTGYTQQEIQGRTTEFARSERHPPSFYETQKAMLRQTGSWKGEAWLRRKDGREDLVRLVVSAIRNARGEVTHFVSHSVDVTQSHLQEQERLRREASHRKMLVREVHHRIKNNLQGITGVLRQLSHKHPETMDMMNQVIHQVQAISFIHGLQGREVNAAVQLGELATAIAAEIAGVWQTPVNLSLPQAARHWCIAENEAVPIALVLNELVSNAVKHGVQPDRHVNLVILESDPPGGVRILISNPGLLRPQGEVSDQHHTGLQLVAALLPAAGAQLALEQQGEQVVAQLELQPPVVYRNQKEPP